MSQIALDRLKEKLGDAVLETHSRFGDDTAVVRADAWKAACEFLRSDGRLDFDLLVDLTAVELSLNDAAGKAIELEPASTESKMGTIVTRTLQSALPAGTYHVKWRVLSIDGHHTRGDYTFDVKTPN